MKNTKLEFVDHEIMNQLSYEISNKKFMNKGFQFESNIEEEINNTIKSLIRMNCQHFNER